MKLRTRVLIGFTMIFVIVIAAGFFTVTAQRNQLYDQIDNRLVTTPLPPQVRTAQPPDRSPEGSDPPAAGDVDRVAAVPVDGDNISDLYVAVLTDSGQFRPVIEGQRLDDAPDLQSLLEDPLAANSFRTIGGVNGTSTFRVLLLEGSDTSLNAIVAVPVDDVEDTIGQLRYILFGVVGLTLLALVMIASWINRFGLRPIAAMTDVATAITSGERDRRAAVDSDSTEAGRLGEALNVMLDERDSTETRLREFVSNASHELRTPLTSIRGYLDLYANGGFRQPGELDDAMRRLQGESERMSLLVDDLLVLAKLDEERPLDIGEVRLDEVARDVAALALAAHPDRQITVRIAQEITLQGDRMRLQQALAVLVENAVRHTPQAASIQVSATRSDRHVELSVADTGPGLTEEEAAAVFDRFARGDRSRSRSTGGSGLGLSIARSIVRAHGGDISVTTTPGGGATFRITLPV